MAHSLIHQQVVIRAFQPLFFRIQILIAQLIVYLIGLWTGLGEGGETVRETVSQIQVLGVIAAELYVSEGLAIHGDAGEADLQAVGQLHLHLPRVFNEALAMLLPVPGQVDVQHYLLRHLLTLTVFQRWCQIAFHKLLYLAELHSQLHLRLEIEALLSSYETSQSTFVLLALHIWVFVLWMRHIFRLLFHYVICVQSFYLSLLKPGGFRIQSGLSHIYDPFKLAPFLLFLLQFLECLVGQHSTVVHSQQSVAELLDSISELVKGFLASLHHHPQYFTLLVDHLPCQTCPPYYHLVLTGKAT